MFILHNKIYNERSDDLKYPKNKKCNSSKDFTKIIVANLLNRRNIKRKKTND